MTWGRVAHYADEADTEALLAEKALDEVAREPCDPVRLTAVRELLATARKALQAAHKIAKGD